MENFGHNHAVRYITTLHAPQELHILPEIRNASQHHRQSGDKMCQEITTSYICTDW